MQHLPEPLNTQRPSDSTGQLVAACQVGQLVAACQVTQVGNVSSHVAKRKRVKSLQVATCAKVCLDVGRVFACLGPTVCRVQKVRRHHPRVRVLCPTTPHTQTHTHPRS
jgi:hypothetical protein